ncbi:MAG: Wzz/FepE/Etk N-terminal domain-containing protein [Pseudomonadota bacterium]
MDLKQRQLASKYIDLLFRRKILILTLFLLSMPIGLGIYLITPKIYEATCLLSYEQQKISPNKMSPEVVSRIRDIVSTLTQIVTSRTNLEKLIVDLKLYPEAREKKPMEDVVDLMRREIHIEPSKQGDIFRITFSHGVPEKVVKVTNALAAKFIEENLKYREERATETSSYTSDELMMAKETMDRKENAMRDFKLTHYNEMPEQRDANVGRMIALQKQYQDNQTSIQDLERTCILIQDQISNRKKVLETTQEVKVEIDETGRSSAQAQPISNEARLAKGRLVLEQLLTRYTEKHPEVKRTREIIAKLEIEVAKDKSIGDAANNTPEVGSASDGSNSSVTDRTGADPVILQLETQLKSVLLNIETIKAERVQEKKLLSQYEEWLAATPTREAEWSGLTREYAQLKRHYDYLVSQDLEAKSMLNLEKRQKGSQFKIEDSARQPEKPIKPNFMKIMGMAVAVGLGVGIGLSLVLEFFDSTFRDPEVLEFSFAVPLLTTVSHIEIPSEKKRRKALLLFQVIYFLVGVISVVAVFVVVWRKGYIVI